MPLHRILTLLASSLFLISCSEESSEQNSSNRTLPESTGKINELVVVMSQSLWEGDAGATFKKHFEKEVEGLPQREPSFTLVHIRPQAFTSIFMSHRNLIVVETDTMNSVQMARNVYARNQYVAQIKGSSEEELVLGIKKTCKDIRNKFQKEELRRLQAANQKASLASFMAQMKKDYGLEIIIPKDFRLNVEGENFFWLNREKPFATEGLLIHFTPAYNDMTMMADILNRRDSVCKIYVEGELEDTYMQIERIFDPEMNPFEINGTLAVETRGLWRMENDFLGGPFMSYTILDEENDRAVTIDAFVFAPAKDKRNYMTQLEAIVSSSSLVKN